MNLVPLFNKVLLGACESSLDIAGAALLPGAWPILKGALTPVLDRLKERLGSEDLTTSPEQANKAIAAFEADTHLQEFLRSNLLERLDDLVKSQQDINADVHKLMLMVTGDQKLLQEIVGNVAHIEQQLENGVNLSSKTMGQLNDMVRQLAENSREVRAIALSEMGPVAQLVGRQVSRLQARAVELIDDKQLDRAIDELDEGRALVAALLNEAPTDNYLLMQLGMIYKTSAQIWQAAGDSKRVDANIQRAEDLFQYVKDVVPGDDKTKYDYANAIHGLGNMKQMRGDVAGALENYKLATALFPQHCYAWHDMFLCYYELAKSGIVDLDAMRHSLDQTRVTGEGEPGLGAKHIIKMEEILRWVENNPVQNSTRAVSAQPSAVDKGNVNVSPLALTVVICESEPYVPVVNLNCEFINNASSAINVEKLDLLVISPAGDSITFPWTLFYSIRPPGATENKLMRMTKNTDAHIFALAGNQHIAFGIQFKSATIAQEKFWLPGEYQFELRGNLNAQAGQTSSDIRAKFIVNIHEIEKIQIDQWINASKSQWDALGDPDRAVGISLEIKIPAEAT